MLLLKSFRMLVNRRPISRSKHIQNENADALKTNKQVQKIWKVNRPQIHIDYPSIIEKNLTRKISRTEIRTKELRKKHNNFKNSNNDVKISTQAQTKSNIFINDLNVYEDTLNRGSILPGRHIHLNRLAVPTEHPT